MFFGLGWEKEIKSLKDFDVHFIPSSDYDIRAGNQCSDNYDPTPFSQSTQAWRLRKQEEQKQYAKNITWRAYVQEKDVTINMNSESNVDDDLNVDNLMNTDKRFKVVGDSLRPLLFRERMRKLSPHCVPLKERMRDKTVSYVDLFQPDPPPPRRGDRKQFVAYMRSETHS